MNLTSVLIVGDKMAIVLCNLVIYNDLHGHIVISTTPLEERYSINHIHRFRFCQHIRAPAAPPTFDIRIHEYRHRSCPV